MKMKTLSIILTYIVSTLFIGIGLACGHKIYVRKLGKKIEFVLFISIN